MKKKIQKTLKHALCYVLALGMVAGSALPAKAENDSATLIAKYDFENVSGTTVPNVADGAAAFTGTLNGSNVSIEESVLGKSLKFTNGTDGHMVIDKIVNTGTTSYSMAMWYKYDTTADRAGKKVVLLQQGGGGRTLLTLTPQNTYHSYVNTEDKFSTGTVNVGNWQHVIFVNDAENQKVKFYINGVLDFETDAGSGKVDELTNLLIGRHKNGGSDPLSMRGLVDEICIYEGMVTDEEAKALYEEKAELVNNQVPEVTPTPEVSSVEITVNPEKVERTIDASVFGINHRYAFNGYGTFDSYLMEMKDDFKELYEEAGFGSIRYPGGTISNLFNWKTTLDSVGRKNQIHGFYNNAGQGGIAPNFGIKEIADFADDVDSEIVYVYSLGRGSVQDAQDLIEFLNAEVGTNPNGGIDWAAVRAESGHPKPYNVRYFEIGNEMQQVYADGTSSQGYWLHGVPNAENGYIEGGTATFTKQYAVCEEDWNSVASKSDGSANLVRYMRYANTNPKTYDENGKIVDDKTFEAVNKESVAVYVGNEQWTIVESFDNSSSTDKHVVVDYSTGAIHFGDDVKGAIPEAGQQIHVSYSADRDGFVDISKAMKETTAAINAANTANGVETQHEAYVYSSFETQGFVNKMSSGGYNEWYDGLTIHPYSGTPDETSTTTFYDTAMQKAESTGVAHVQNYVNMMPEDKVPVISEYGIFRSTNPLVRSQTHAIYIAKVLMEYVRLGSPYIQKHCLTDWYSSGADSLGPTQQAVIQVVAQNGANTKTGEGEFAFFSTPSARVFQMMNNSFGNEVLEINFNVNEKLATGVAAYSALASKDEYNNYYVAVVNVDRENAKEFEVKVDGVDLTDKDVEVQLLSSDSYTDENTLENPNKIAVETTTYVNAKETITLEIPKHAFAVVKVSTGVDKTALEEMIVDAEDLVKDDYTVDSWKDSKVDAALVEAKAVLKDTAVAKEDVTAALDKLAKAMDALEIIQADKTKLEKAIEKAGALESSGYTGESWNAMQVVLSAAQNVKTKENASQEIVDKVVKDLQAAISALKAVIPVSEMNVTAGDFQEGQGPENVKDGDPGTLWHTNWKVGPNHDNHWLQIELSDAYMVNGFQYLPRQSGGNGMITAYEIHVSMDGEAWEKVAEGTWAADASWKTVEFDVVDAKYVKLVTVAAQSDQAVKFASAAEIRLIEEIPEPEVTPEVTPDVTPEEKEDVSDVFEDVKGEAWYEPGVQYVYNSGLMNGSNGKFNPTADITRAQLVTTLYRLAGSPEVTDRKALTDFSDVVDEKYYTDAVCWAYAEGIATGNDGKFNPNANLIRQQMAAFFFRYAEYAGLDIEVREDISAMYGADKVSGYAKDAVEWAVGAGLISGSEKTVNGVTVKDLNPRGNTTRAQVATIIMRFCAE